MSMRECPSWRGGLLAALLLAVSALPSLGQERWEDRALARSLSAPLGLPPVAHPAGNIPTADKISLGRKLFFDRRLSLNRTMSCAMCHVPEQAFANRELAQAVGFEGRTVRRNSPTILNVAYYTDLFVDGRETGLETQYLSPLTARNEMANPSAGYVVSLIAALPDYAGLFEQAFGAAVSVDRIGMALAAYQRTLIAANSPFDRWRYGGEEGALSDAAKHGFALFNGAAGCSSCHLIGDHDALFTDHDYHDIGYGWRREQIRQHPPEATWVEVEPGERHLVPQELIASVSQPVAPDLGRYEVTQDPADSWKFRTPSLRNVALTGPYMHDGGVVRLRDVIKFYNAGGAPHRGQSILIRPLGLSETDIDDLIAFLEALTSPDLEQLAAEGRSHKPDNW